LGNKALPLYHLLKKIECFAWTSNTEEALNRLKGMLTSPLVLVPPQPTKPLLLYIVVATQVVSAAIVVERQEEGHTPPVQRPVYFVSEVHSETKICYPQIQKLIYTIIVDIW
jgi:hypothetical protein